MSKFLWNTKGPDVIWPKITLGFPLYTPILSNVAGEMTMNPLTWAYILVIRPCIMPIPLDPPPHTLFPNTLFPTMSNPFPCPCNPHPPPPAANPLKYLARLTPPASPNLPSLGPSGRWLVAARARPAAKPNSPGDWGLAGQ